MGGGEGVEGFLKQASRGLWFIDRKRRGKFAFPERCYLEHVPSHVPERLCVSECCSVLTGGIEGKAAFPVYYGFY
jgi:hypothetical protein